MTPFDFPIACFRFRLLVKDPITLPVYKGSTFHGGFSRALGQIGSRFRDYFFAPQVKYAPGSSTSIPKPFMLIPPLEEKIRYQPGEILECGLTLYGEAVSHFMIAFAALENLGQVMGLGRDQGKYRITQVDFLGLDGAQPVWMDEAWFPIPEPVRARDLMLPFREVEAETLDLHLITRLRLKENNRLVRRPPVFLIFLDRLLGRINSLGVFFGSGPLLSFEEKDALIHLAAGVHLRQEKKSAYWSEWERPVKSGRDAMSFGGLLGSLHYTGDLSPFLPWLNLGQWTGVGGKTSFGFGLYHLEMKGGLNDGCDTLDLW